MQLNDLPDDVLEMVFKFLVLSPGSVREAFHGNLALLSACTRWRQLAFRMVYDTIYIQCGNSIKRRPGYMGASPHTMGMTDNLETETNLELVAATVRPDAVKKMVLGACSEPRTLLQLRSAIASMCTVADKWMAITELTIVTGEARRFSLAHYGSATHYEDDMRECTAALGAMLPRVRKLILTGVTRNSIFTALYENLAGFYASQLQVLRSEHPVTAPQDIVFTQLKRVSIKGAYYPSYQLPRMCPESIECLKLEGITPSHSWATFSADNNGRVIIFPKLRKLSVVSCQPDRVRGAVEQHSTAPKWELQFPSLDHLAVQSHGTMCPLLEYAVLPPRMQSIDILASTAIYDTIASAGFPTAERLTLRVPRLQETTTGSIGVLNRLLVGAKGCKWKELEIEDMTIRVFPESITCTDLTRLLVAASTSVDTMLGLISRLPNLDCLLQNCLRLDDMQWDISIPDSGSHEHITSLGTKIRRLGIYFSPQQLVPELAGPVIEYLLLAIPTLTKLSAVQVPKRLVTEFVRRYSQQYPHLTNINFELHVEESSCNPGI